MWGSIAHLLCILWYKHHTWHKSTLTYGKHFQILSHSEFSLHVRHIWIQNGRHLKSTFAHICGSKIAIAPIMVPKYRFLGARNPIATFYIAYSSLLSHHIGYQNGHIWNLHFLSSVGLMLLSIRSGCLKVCFGGQEIHW